MTLPDDWICPSRERCLCGSICEAREAMDPPEPIFVPGEATTAECSFRCGYVSSGDDLEDHERHEHTTCQHCGGEPNPPQPVSHAANCERVSEEPEHA